MTPFIYIFSFDIAEGKGYPLHRDPHILVVRVHHPSKAKFHLEFLGFAPIPIEDIDVTADFSCVNSISLSVVIWVPPGR